MTAFLFIPARGGASQRVDLANIASLFSEVEEPHHAPIGSGFILRACAAALLVLLAFGDTVLVNQSNVLATPVLRHALMDTDKAVNL